MAVPLTPHDDTPALAPAGKSGLDTNHYMRWRDGHYPAVDTGEKTVCQPRQEQWAASTVVQAFTQIQAPRSTTAGRPAGCLGRVAVPITSDVAEAARRPRRGAPHRRQVTFVADRGAWMGSRRRPDVRGLDPVR